MLRAGGNRNGADAVLAWQTGYPLAVDFARGAPRYAADIEPRSLLTGDAFDAMLLVGDARGIELPPIHRRAAIGPRASEGPMADAHVVIDTGVAGIHETGMAFRMDDVPLPLRQVLSGPASCARVLATLGERLTRADA
jgi:formylmethanofuran dehydrogenase subunit B